MIPQVIWNGDIDNFNQELPTKWSFYVEIASQYGIFNQMVIFQSF